jgi:hypothetical protein
MLEGNRALGAQRLMMGRLLSLLSLTMSFLDTPDPNIHPVFHAASLACDLRFLIAARCSSTYMLCLSLVTPSLLFLRTKVSNTNALLFPVY